MQGPAQKDSNSSSTWSYFRTIVIVFERIKLASKAPRSISISTVLSVFCRAIGSWRDA